ncbi:MAG: SDR family oxidoreductase, partial [Dehalococcoidia bacterium]|nr:SDR family oxidoreductase [Dehalococcoidia bacterium]
IRADVSDVAASRRFFEEVSHDEGRLDALINNAAIQVCKPLVETTPEEWDAVMSSNLRSVYLAVRHAYPLMQENGGAIVNVSSVHAIATSANIAAYAASKGAILSLTRALAIELAPDKIRVNAILPGAVDTPMLHEGLARGHLQGANVQELMQELGRRTVMGRVGQPEEIAQTILFLADNSQSSFMTGQALVVDGGATARLSTE